jgi:hypothetical protein
MFWAFELHAVNSTVVNFVAVTFHKFQQQGEQANLWAKNPANLHVDLFEAVKWPQYGSFAEDKTRCG